MASKTENVAIAHESGVQITITHTFPFTCYVKIAISQFSHKIQGCRV